jgi:formylglycine-generating enzyme required for sulfatase activity
VGIKCEGGSRLLRVVGVVATLLIASSCAAPLPADWSEPTTGMEFVLIQPGEFKMGLSSPPDDTLRPAPEHSVRIPSPFYLARFEVTQAQWETVMGTTPSQFADCGPLCPVESISWHQAEAFLAALAARTPGEVFRLPTEAEWEYACRAGSGARYGVEGDVLSSNSANFDARIPFEGVSESQFVGHPTPVGTYAANRWGLSDLSGNVWEWTSDEYCPYPPGPTEGARRSCGSDTIAIRGGSWAFSANAARCGRRYVHHRDDSGYSIGLRVVREVPPR